MKSSFDNYFKYVSQEWSQVKADVIILNMFNKNEVKFR